MPPGPASPASMPTSRNTSSNGAPKRSRNQARHDAGQHQERTEQNADADRVERGPWRATACSHWKAAARSGNEKHSAGRGISAASPARAGRLESRAGDRVRCVRAECLRSSPWRSRARPSPPRWRRACFRCSISASEWARAMIGSARVELPRLRDHLTALERVGDRDQQAARRRQVGGADHLGIGGIAGDGLPSPRPGAPATRSASSSITSNGDLAVGSAALMKLPTRPWPTSTTWSVSAVGGTASRGGGFRGAGCVRRRISLSAFASNAVERGKQQRIEQDRQDRAGQDQIAPPLRQQRQATRRGRPG